MRQKDVNILRQEFIGKKIKDKKRGHTGKILDETKNSFVVQTKYGEKRLLKSGTIFELATNDGKVEIEGKLIALRPEDRIKIKKWK